MPAREARCILLVEDHEDTAFVAAKLLRLRGYEVVVARSIATALAAAAQSRIDMALCDIGLPDGDGCDLMRQLRERYGLPGIALTGYSMGEEDGRIRSAGFTARLVKPVDFGDLCRAVEDALSQAENGQGQGDP